MARQLNILVTGPFGVGKSQFIETISDIPVVSTERRISRPMPTGQKDTTTVAMDYGRVEIDPGLTLHLRGTPGQERFDFMWDILAREIQGYLFLVDSTRSQDFPLANAMLMAFNDLHGLPHVIVATKQDLPEALRVDVLRRELGISHRTLIMPCSATSKTSVRQVLKQLVHLIL